MTWFIDVEDRSNEREVHGWGFVVESDIIGEDMHRIVTDLPVGRYLLVSLEDEDDTT